MRKALLLFLCWFTAASLAQASDATKISIPHAEIVGAGRLSIAFWDVYDATLYAPYGEWREGGAQALSIRYLREIEGGDIADRSAEEIHKQGFNDEEKLKNWLAQMHNIFPNVKHGEMLTAVFTPSKSTVFYHDNKRIGAISGEAFGKHFFGIWLSEKTSEPRLRKKLLGLP